MPMSTTICKNNTLSCFFSTIDIYFSFNVLRVGVYSTIFLQVLTN